MVPLMVSSDSVVVPSADALQGGVHLKKNCRRLEVVQEVWREDLWAAKDWDFSRSVNIFHLSRATMRMHAASARAHTLCGQSRTVRIPHYMAS